MTTWAEVQHSDSYMKVLDHGFVGLVDVMGDDSAIVQAARTSYGKGTKSVSEYRGLIRYLMRKKHTSVFEMVEFKFHIKLPIFVMRQHVRHRTANLNEYSGRYSIMTDEFYIPEPTRMQSQSAVNKQGSGTQLNDAELALSLNLIKNVSAQNYLDYLTLVNEPGGATWDLESREGLSRELSRIILPQNNYTECYWKIDLKNLLHYIGLRADPHAQWEIQQFARALAQFVKQRCPVAFEAFEDYMEHSLTMSRLDMNLLKSMITYSNEFNLSFADSYAQLIKQAGGVPQLQKAYGMSKREFTEFEQTWGLIS